MNSLEALRRQLDQIIDEAVRDRESALAIAIEDATADAVRASWEQSRETERMRILALIDAQRTALKRGSVNSMVLDTLRRMVLDESTYS